ncbi:MAG: hypothetical protein K2X86_12365 [Cytophagaceae bacterium]|nr:hypothetical protein [Cytophagaceae bacterium]
MKSIFNKVFIVTGIIALGSCAGFEPVSLDHSYQIAVDEDPIKGIPILTYNKGMFEDFKGDISAWWGGDGIVISKKGDTMVIQCKNIGSKYTPFGRQLPPLNFSEAPVLKVRARCEGMLVPTVRIDIKDVNGYTANLNSPSQRIKKSGEYTDYYFNFKDKFKQGWPENKPVDPTLISDIMFFINPGAADWTGTIYIDEIKAVRVEDIPSKTPKPTTTTTTTTTTTNNTAAESEMVDNFDEGIAPWWGADKYVLEKVEPHAMRIDIKGAGPAYEAFGRGFPVMNFTNATTLRVRARAEGSAEPELRIDLKDSEGRLTNAKFVSNKIAISNEFKDYYFNYKGKFQQGWPDAQKVNPADIVEVVCFVNGGKGAYTGKIIIDEIEVIPDKPAATTTTDNNTNNNTTTTVSAGQVLIDDFSIDINNWWGSDKMQLEKADETMKVSMTDVGKSYETFGRGFPMIDFTKTPVVKVRVKLAGDKQANLRVDVKDTEGVTTNAKPVQVKLAAGGDFVDYYFDFTDKFEQGWPNAAKVNPKEIAEMLLFINPGGEPFTGVMYIDEIKVMSLEDFKNKK